eukprot:CAMPEP_0195305882 /NCGR_PEP_ID=MMETSP0707-20130614/36918_1 /TAXON_ID=33640 /ORGANISM="Asterionellopsis glacialis, Strain CCMP134" /LENGTH=1040 /DNA_ID=CAMNT_0040370089 /DNA_START=879 /DNA_END=4001 /DNA_ORIENTATION=-
MYDADMTDVETKLVHHGAAANLSCSHALAWIPSLDGIVYSSHSILNICHSETTLGEPPQIVWNVQQTLRSKTVDGIFDAEVPSPAPQRDEERMMKTVAHLKCVGGSHNHNHNHEETFLATGFSDGTVNVWYHPHYTKQHSHEWKEYVLVTPNQRSITDLSGMVYLHPDTQERTIVIVTGSSEGVHLICHSLPPQDGGTAPPPTSRTKIASYVTNTVLVEWVPLWGQDHQILILTGTAQPRHNKIHVYTLDSPTAATTATASVRVHHCGHLSGHEDWITSLAWHNTTNTASDNNSHHHHHHHHHDDETHTMMLASGSQDARVRLWKFTTTPASTEDEQRAKPMMDDNDDDHVAVENEDLELSDEEDDDNNQEARLELFHSQSSKVTRITLEALLFGHEESVTSVTWHPNPQPYYGQDIVLISSSMDRTLLIWGTTTTTSTTTTTTAATLEHNHPSSCSGVWTPLTRVGSAGGIIGGSIGSTLLGFVNVAIEPVHGTRLLGHAYGGSLHGWTMEMSSTTLTPSQEEEKEEGGSTDALSLEDRASRIKWKATACLTGHFNGVTDLCWDALSGKYLLTTSNDQTCRLWGCVNTASSTPQNNNSNNKIWIELARPQVHGYDLTTLTSISTKAHPYWMVSGADEKELRVFDAPKTTLRMLQAIGGGNAGGSEKGKTNDSLSVERVERAYIPSLGLSNKAEAADGAEEEEEIMATKGSKEEQDDTPAAAATTTIPHEQKLPSERDLGVLSLWPEVRKLYGHNTELFCLTSTVTARTALPASYRGDDGDDDVAIVASSAKARDVENASIRLWDVEQGTCLQILKGGHRSTVAALSFSPNGQYLSSSGKDRRLCIWRRNTAKGDDDHSSPLFSLATAVDSAHKRIVWSVHFCPFDSTILASGSRDGCIKIWKILEAPQEQTSQENSCTIEELYSFEPCARAGKKADSVTALSFAPKPRKTQQQGDSAVLAIGVESGLIELWQVPLVREAGSVDCCSVLECLPIDTCHASSVTKLAWKPLREEEANNEPQLITLASSSMDYGCRIFEVKL